MTISKWDARFLLLAQQVASWSKDPSTKTGAVIVDHNRRVVSVGYNGFPMGMRDDDALYADREFKYAHIVHCERNAMLFAQRDLHDCTLYTWPFMSCTVCAAMVAQTGIWRCVAPESDNPRWQEDFAKTRKLFDDCEITLDTYTLEDIISNDARLLPAAA